MTAARALLALSVVALACGDPTAPMSIEVTPTSVTLEVGQTVQLTARLRNAAGHFIDGPVTWRSEDPTLATVSATGLVTDLAPGPVRITASTSGGLYTSATITGTSQGTVLAAVATVTITPATWSVLVGDTLRLRAILKDKDGNVLTGRIVTWSSSNPSVATVDASGLVLGVGPGTVIISAASEGKTSGMAPARVGRPIGILPATSDSTRLCVDTAVQLVALAAPGTDVHWWSSVGGFHVDGTGRVTRSDPGFAYVVIIAMDGPPALPLGNVGDEAPGVPADTAWLVFSGPSWPNEPESSLTEGVWCG